MLKNPQDRRAKRTAMQIKETMFSFMESKAIHEISVSEICKTCQINRATFYNHYRDVFDLVQDMEKDLLLTLEERMEQVLPEETPAEEVSRLFFHFLTEHKQKLCLLLTNERSREFCIRLDTLLTPFFEKKVRQTYVIPEWQEVRLRQTMEFVSTGYYRVFFQTLTDPLGNMTEQAELCVRLSDACLELLFEKKP